MSTMTRPIGLLNLKQPLPFVNSVKGENLLTFDEACSYLGINMPFLCYLIQEGEIIQDEDFKSLIPKTELEFKKNIVNNLKMKALSL